MKALLRADWLRLRRRKDLWVIAIAILVIGGVSFLAGYQSEVADPEWPDAAQIRQEAIDFNYFEGTPEEIAAQIDQMVADQTASYDQYRAEWEVQQAETLQKYDVLQAPFTVIGSGLTAMIALILIAAFAVGDEFRFGTIRTSLLAAAHRRRFLAARLASLFVVTAALFAALAALGLILGVLLRLAGAEVAATTTPIDGGASLAWFASLVLSAVVLVVIGVALTVLIRSGAMPLLLIVLFGGIELFLSALPIFRKPELLSGVPQAFLTTSIRTLTGQLGIDTHAVALARTELPEPAIVLPQIVVAAFIVAWGVLFVVIADRRLRTMDIVE